MSFFKCVLLPLKQNVNLHCLYLVIMIRETWLVGSNWQVTKLGGGEKSKRKSKRKKMQLVNVLKTTKKTNLKQSENISSWVIVFLHRIFFVTTELDCYLLDFMVYDIAECRLLPKPHAVILQYSANSNKIQILSWTFCGTTNAQGLIPLRNLTSPCSAHATLISWKSVW